MTKIKDINRILDRCFYPRQSGRTRQIVEIVGVRFKAGETPIELRCCTEWKNGECELMGKSCKTPQITDNGGPISAIIDRKITEYPC